jgi:hypothetical protein
MTPELKRLLNDLVEEYGDTHTSKVHKTEYKSIHKTKRKDAIRCLVNTLRQAGRDREFFETSSFQSEVSKFFFPDVALEGFPKSKIEGGRKVVCVEIDQVVAELWKGEQNLCKVTPSEPKPRAVEPEAPKLREDVKGSVYETEEHVLDEEFARQLREVENE